MANKKWIQKANRQMKKKGTVGKFTEYCGGRVTQGCIDKAKRSGDTTLVRRAVFAENMRGLGKRKKAQSGLGLMENEEALINEVNQEAQQAQQEQQQPSAVAGLLDDLNVAPGQGEVGKGAQMLDTLKSGIGAKIGDLKAGIAGGTVSLSAAGDVLGGLAETGFNKASGTASDALRDDKTERAGAVVGGALSGAGKGFDIGNKIVPGLGGAIGAGLGAIAGGIGGNKKREKERIGAVRQLREQQAQDAAGQLAADAAFMARAGGMKLPGGQVVPMPDGGKEYIGRKHESGGIDLKKDNIEVEGGETERPIKRADGKMIDYIFSEHHKVGKKMQKKYRVGGKASYADIHKMMEGGKIPKDYQGLAKDQEEDMRKKGKDQHGPRGAKYIKRRGGVKRRKAQAGDGPYGGYSSRFEQIQAEKNKPKEATADPKKAKIDEEEKVGKYEGYDSMFELREAQKNNPEEAKKRKAQFEAQKEDRPSIGERAISAAKYIYDHPADAGQVALGGLAIGADFIPGIGNAVSMGADAANAAISAYRAKKYAEKGDTKNAAFYSGLAALDTAAAAPGIGNVAGSTKIGALLAKGAGKVVKEGSKAAKVAHDVGHAAHHVAHVGSQAVTAGKTGSLASSAAKAVDSKPPKKSRDGGAKMKAQFSLPPASATEAAAVMNAINTPIPVQAQSDVQGPTTNPQADTGPASGAGAAATTPSTPFSNTDEGNRFRQWLNDTNPEAARRLDLDASGSYDNAYIRRAYREFGDEFDEFMTAENAPAAQPAGDDPKEDTTKSVIDQIGEANTAEDVAKIEGAEKVEPQKTEEQEDLLTETEVEDDVAQMSRKELNQQMRDIKKIYQQTPPESVAAGVAQLAAPLFALRNRPPRVGGYRAQTMKAPNLGRVSGEADKDRVDKNHAAMLAAMEGQNIGPGMAANMANLAAKTAGAKLAIDAQTRRANMNLAAQEAQMQSRASEFNINQQTAAQQYMRGLALKQNQEEYAQKLGSLDAMGDRLAGIAGDMMSYKSNYAQAKAAAVGTQDEQGMDVLDRHRLRMLELRDAMKDDIAALKEQKKAGKQAQKDAKKSAKEISKANKEAAKAQKKREKEEEKAATQRSGGYIRRRGKVRRRK